MNNLKQLLPTSQRELEQIRLNKFKQPVYDPANLIDFKRKSLWMTGIERVTFSLNGYNAFLIVCGFIALYFITRGLW